MDNIEVVDCKISNLKNADYNPRKISKEQLSTLMSSLEKFDCAEPAVININPDRKNVIVGGHQRVKAAKKLGWKTFPCLLVDLNLQDEKELNIRLNKNSGEFDWDLLEANFEKTDLIDWGFDDNDLPWEDNCNENDTENMESENNCNEDDTICEVGDIWLLGTHKLFCGDNTKECDIIINMWQTLNNKDAVKQDTNITYNSLKL